MRHPGIERLRRSVVSRSGNSWRVGTSSAESTLRRYYVQPSFGWCTFRKWLQGHDISMVDFRVLEYWESGNRVVANASDRQKWSKHGVRKLMRKSGLSQKTLYAILRGLSVRAIQLINCFRAAFGTNSVAQERLFGLAHHHFEAASNWTRFTWRPSTARIRIAPGSAPRRALATLRTQRTRWEQCDAGREF
jgi:hypothetical protein